ncbi:MAG: hypothetical protein AAGL17_23085 [Cyanobacteria bacterium J06576_12]
MAPMSLRTNEQASAQIPFDAIIPMAKLTRYLLVEQDRDDKSKFQVVTLVPDK